MKKTNVSSPKINKNTKHKQTEAHSEEGLKLHEPESEQDGIEDLDVSETDEDVDEGLGDGNIGRSVSGILEK